MNQGSPRKEKEISGTNQTQTNKKKKDGKRKKINQKRKRNILQIKLSNNNIGT